MNIQQKERIMEKVMRFVDAGCINSHFLLVLDAFDGDNVISIIRWRIL